ncbi:MAG: LysR family transcriptional regulator [Hydrogenophaga sp.]|uniref:LysR substrate-binding domain-containing protein n=1 Tax=Hydrogenophaga sp. TaxID=1904254 RepID=UPI0026159AEF|nr:LysR family transcriptional regulator [Hydrogenophaga sp.]MCW5670897.1 LysR family transcriptional regulator [Hydrogenophaga sp.]
MKTYPSLRRLQQFRHLSTTLNFRKSAEALRIAQPALSRSIQVLEEELGFQLFVRTTRSMELTPAGAHLLGQLDAVFDGLHQAVRESRRLAGSASKRKLLIGYSAQAANSAMPELLFSFGVGFPDVELNLLQAPSERLFDEVVAGDLDAAFLLLPASLAPSPSLDSVRVDSHPIVALCRVGHPLARKRKLHFKDLQDVGLIIGSPGRWGTFRALLFALFERHGFKPKVVYEPDDTPILLESVARSTHVALYGGGIVGKLPASIVAIALAHDDACLQTHLLWRTPTEGALAELVDFVRNGLPGRVTGSAGP